MFSKVFKLFTLRRFLSWEACHGREMKEGEKSGSGVGGLIGVNWSLFFCPKAEKR